MKFSGFAVVVLRRAPVRQRPGFGQIKRSDVPGRMGCYPNTLVTRIYFLSLFFSMTPLLCTSNPGMRLLPVLVKNTRT